MQTNTIENTRHEKLDQIDQQVIRAKQLLQDINEARYQCLGELAQRKEFVSWVREALKGTVITGACGRLGVPTALGVAVLRSWWAV